MFFYRTKIFWTGTAASCWSQSTWDRSKGCCRTALASFRFRYVCAVYAFMVC